MGIHARNTLLILLLLLLSACGGAEPASSPAPEGPPTRANGTAANTGSQGEAQPAPDGTPAANSQPIPSPLAQLSPPPIPQDMQGKLVIWHSWAQRDGDALTQILAAARQEYPNLQVDTLFVAVDDVPDAYANAVRAGGGPDLLLAPDWWLGDLVQANALAPLNDWVDEEALAAYFPATLASLERGGDLYGLPTSFELVALYYNRSLATPEQAPTTTSGWLAQTEANPVMGGGLYVDLFHLYWGIPAYGGRLFDDTYKAVLDATDGAAEYLTWLRQASQTTGMFVSSDYSMLLDRFKKGEFAFLVDGPWSADQLQEALGADLGVTRLPDGPLAPAQPWLSVDAVFVNPNGPPSQTALAVAFARFLTNAENGAILANVAHRLPANRQSQGEMDPVRQGFVEQAATAQPMPNVTEMQALWGYGGDMLVKVISGGEEPTATVSETTALINEANGK